MDLLPAALPEESRFSVFALFSPAFEVGVILTHVGKVGGLLLSNIMSSAAEPQLFMMQCWYKGLSQIISDRDDSKTYNTESIF